jgi:hypothetical protein
MTWWLRAPQHDDHGIISDAATSGSNRARASSGHREKHLPRRHTIVTGGNLLVTIDREQPTLSIPRHWRSASSAGTFNFGGNSRPAIPGTLTIARN